MSIFSQVIDTAISKKASDIHITNNLCPTIRVEGELVNLREIGVINKSMLKEIVTPLIIDKEKYDTYKYIDISYSHKEYRFRMHIYKQQGCDAISMRAIPTTIPRLKELNIPQSVEKFAHVKNGLVLVTGTTGSGKSTTLASLIDVINENQKKHIITAEDPIEFIHKHKQSMINQKEVGKDITSFAEAVRAAMREDPDILMIGEMRDLETIQNAITMAETGHLVFATLHTKSAAETVDRIIDVFPSEQQSQIRIQFASVLQGIISQHLVPMVGGGRIPICEILISNDAIRSLIKDKGPSNSIMDAMQMNHKLNGSQSLYQGIAALYKSELISYETAMNAGVNTETLKNFLM